MPEHAVYPYLLWNLTVSRVNQVWAADITCIPMARGFVYLVAIIDRLQSKLHEIKTELKRRLHHPVPEVGQWLKSVRQGHFNYYAVPRNQRKLGAFKYQVYRLWLRTLRQRSQRHRMTGERMNRLAARWFPPIRILHPYPEQRLRVMT